MPQPDNSPSNLTAHSLGEFAKRVLVVVLIGALVYAMWRLADLAILFFAAVLLAIGLRSGARFVSRKTRLGLLAALGLVILLLLASFISALWFFGTVAADQLDEVAQQALAGLKMLMERLQGDPYGRYALERLQGAGWAGGAGWAASLLAAIMQGIMVGTGYAAVTFFAAIYLAAQPELYRRLCLKLLPKDYRAPVFIVFDRSTQILKRWLAGQFAVMVIIGVLSGCGLWALGIKAAFALGLVGGLLAFIPYAGPILAAIPATLVALTQGPTQAGMVILMYICVHFVEGNFITPLVQEEVTALPPVIALLATVGFSVLFGASGVLLAAPLALFLMATVKVLWVEQALAG